MCKDPAQKACVNCSCSCFGMMHLRNSQLLANSQNKRRSIHWGEEYMNLVCLLG